MRFGHFYIFLLVLGSKAEFLDECLAHDTYSFHYEGFCYIIRPSSTMNNALEECVEDFPPHGRLTIIPNQDTMQHIFEDLFTAQGLSYDPYIAVREISDVWKWMGPGGRESPMGPGGHAFWASGNPQSGNCATLEPDEGLDTTDCTFARKYLCTYPDPSLHKHHFKSIKNNAKGVSSAAYNITGGVESVHACINACAKKEGEYCYSLAYSKQEKTCIFYWVPAGVMQIEDALGYMVFERYVK